LQTLHATAERLATGLTSSAELVKEALIKATDADGEGARVFTKLYHDQALAAAEASDRMRQFGIVPSPLAGIPISVKDLFDVAGEVTRAGSTVLAGAAPAARDAPIVVRLRAAGAILIGRTNMTEFAYSGLGLNPHYGTPANPFDRRTRRIPGGSSAGAVVSVTDGMAVGAIGSDTGGSTRIPAALCGAVGYKPTRSRIPLAGAFPLAPSFDSIGPIGPSVACCALLDAVLAGASDLSLPAPRAAGTLTFGIIENWFLEDVADDVARAFEAACSALEAAGARLVRLTLPELKHIPEMAKLGGIAAAESYFVHRPYRHLFAGYDPLVLERILAGEAITAHDYLDFLRIRGEMVAAFDALGDGLDGILAPTTPRTAPPIAELAEDATAYRAVNRLMLRNASVFNLLDGCAISLPCHDPGSAPVGLMIAAPGGCDRALFAAALTAETLMPA